MKTFVVCFGVSCNSANLISHDTKEVVALGSSGWISAEKRLLTA